MQHNGANIFHNRRSDGHTGETYVKTRINYRVSTAEILFANPQL